MYLRLTSLDSNQTLSIIVPNSYSFLQLKETIFHSLSPSSSSHTSPSSLHLSFNRHDEIIASSPHDSLHSLGINDGDFLFFTPNPNVFSLQTLIQDKITADIDGTDAPSIPEPEKFPTLDVSEVETMDKVDGSVAAVIVLVSDGKSNSQNSFLKSVLNESPGNEINEFKLLFYAVHSVFLESGFVLVDNAVADFSNSYVFLHSAKSFKYSLLDILTNSNSHIMTVILKFQTLGHFINVYGSLSGVIGSGLHSACLEKCKFARPLANLLKNSESESVILGLWNMVKDKLALPLLIDLCDVAGLKLPPCFTCLPSEIKLKILEFIPGVDLAKASCVCRELRNIASSDDLWKLKFEDEFKTESARGWWWGKDSKDSYKDSILTQNMVTHQRHLLIHQTRLSVARVVITSRIYQ